MDKTFKFALITTIGLAVFIYWMSVPTEDDTDLDDPDVVTIEYRCSELPEYTDVPEEVLQECSKRRAKIFENRKTI
jgi:hypothetical protein